MMSDADFAQLLAMVRAEFPKATDKIDRLDERIRAMWGGQRMRIPITKEGRPGRLAKPAEVLQRAYSDALGADSNEVITRRHGISRATLYRLMKKGPPGA